MYNIKTLQKEIEKLTEAFLVKYYPNEIDTFWVADDVFGTLCVNIMTYWNLEDVCRIMEFEPAPDDVYMYYEYMTRNYLDEEPDLKDISLVRFLTNTEELRDLIRAEVEVTELRNKFFPKTKYKFFMPNL